MKKLSFITFTLLSLLLFGCSNSDLPLHETVTFEPDNTETQPTESDLYDSEAETNSPTDTSYLWENDDLYVAKTDTGYALYNKAGGTRVRSYSDFAVLEAIEEDGTISTNYLAIGIGNRPTTVYVLDEENGEEVGFNISGDAEFYGDFIIAEGNLMTANLQTIGATTFVEPVTESPKYDDELIFTNEEAGITCRYYLSPLNENGEVDFNTPDCTITADSPKGTFLGFYGTGNDIMSHYCKADLEHQTPLGVYVYERITPYSSAQKIGENTLYTFSNGDCLANSSGVPMLAVNGIINEVGDGEILVLAYGRDGISSFYSNDLTPIVESFGTYAYAANGFMFYQFDTVTEDMGNGTAEIRRDNPRLSCYEYGKGLKTVTECDRLFYLDEFGALVENDGTASLYSTSGEKVGDLTGWHEGIEFEGVSWRDDMIYYYFSEPGNTNKDGAVLQHEWRYPVSEKVLHSTYYGEPIDYDPEYVTSETVTVEVRDLESFTMGDYTYKNRSLLDSDGNEIYHFYRYGSPVGKPVSYTIDAMNKSFTLTFETEHGDEIICTFYSELPSCPVPDGAEIIGEYERNNGYNTLYLHDGKYIYKSVDSEQCLILPVGGDIAATQVYYDTVNLVKQQNGVITMTCFEYVGSSKFPVLYAAVELPINPNDTVTFGEFSIVNIGGTVHAIRDGLYHTYIGEFGISLVGDYIIFHEGPIDGGGTVYNKALEPICDDGPFGSFKQLSDGRYIGTKYTANAGTKALVFDPEGNILLESKPGCKLVGADFIFMLDEDNMLRLYSPDMELLCEFGEMKEQYLFHWMLSGEHTKDGKLGYYFVFEDKNDQDEHHNTREFEYYYIPETGEYGILELGYSSFAYAKPVLYLYPTEKTDITVTFAHPERLTTVYPTYGDGWNVTAQPDGTLTDARGREYYCLYWEESSGKSFYDFPDGFSVAGKDSAAFLEEKLEILGFTEKEANEFIIYWLPILEQSEYNLIRFELTEEREASNALHISPAPDSLLRMAIHIKPMENEASIREQSLPRFKRNGFTAVEWGGCVH